MRYTISLVIFMYAIGHCGCLPTKTAEKGGKSAACRVQSTASMYAQWGCGEAGRGLPRLKFYDKCFPLCDLSSVLSCEHKIEQRVRTIGGVSSKNSNQHGVQVAAPNFCRKMMNQSEFDSDKERICNTCKRTSWVSRSRTRNNRKAYVLNG